MFNVEFKKHRLSVCFCLSCQKLLMLNTYFFNLSIYFKIKHRALCVLFMQRPQTYKQRISDISSTLKNNVYPISFIDKNIFTLINKKFSPKTDHLDSISQLPSIQTFYFKLFYIRTMSNQITKEINFF